MKSKDFQSLPELAINGNARVEDEGGIENLYGLVAIV
jgi:hypothetical protein